MKKRILLTIGGIVCVFAVVFALAREFQPMPVDGVLYFDSDTKMERSKAYEFNLKTKRLRQIKVEGYSRISNITPGDKGYYCMGLSEANGELYVLYCQGQSAKAALPAEHLVTYPAQREFKRFQVYQQGVIFRVPGEDKGVYYADFHSMELYPLPGIETRGSFLQVQDGSVYFNDLSGSVFRLQDGKPERLITQRAFMPLFADSGTLLYSGKLHDYDENGSLLQYNLHTAQEAVSSLHYEPLDYFSPLEYEGGRAVAGGWLIGYQPGMLREWHVSGTGKTTAVNFETGKKVAILKLLWRDAEHLTYAEHPVS